jgi:hypothetical protein
MPLISLFAVRTTLSRASRMGRPEVVAVANGGIKARRVLLVREA